MWVEVSLEPEVDLSSSLSLLRKFESTCLKIAFKHSNKSFLPALELTMTSEYMSEYRG